MTPSTPPSTPPSAPRLHRLRRPAAALAAAALAAVVAPLGAGAAHADADPSASAAPFRLSMPAVVTAYGNNRWAYTETGPRIIAGADDFVLRATRASYDEPIVVRWTHGSTTTTLPADAMTAFAGGLPDFYRVQVRNKKGVLRSSEYQPFCPGYDTQRAVPSAAAHNPYPTGCPYNPYTIGSVMGVPAGWAASTDEYGSEYRIKRGTYTMTTQITAKYRAMFGLTDEADYRAVSTLKVVDQDGEEGFRTSRGTAAHATPAARPAGTRPTGVAHRSAAAAADGPAPDLRALPATGLRISRDGNYLQFAATVWNGGTSPMVVDGYRRSDNDPDLLDAYQYFFDKDGDQTGYQRVGSMEWDPRPSHHHWHFQDFASYTLVKPEGDLAVKSEKEAFCLANTDAVDYTLPDADWHPDGTDLETACGGHDAVAVRESLAVGSGDTYDQSRAGQSFDLRKVKNGTYLVRVEANPGHNLVESDTANNVTDRAVTIGGKPGHRTVKAAPVGIIDEDAYGYYGF